MPLYEFQCTDCSDEFEELVYSQAAVADVRCPECGSAHIRRKVSIFASKGSSIGGSFAPVASSCAPGGT